MYRTKCLPSAETALPTTKKNKPPTSRACVGSLMCTSFFDSLVCSVGIRSIDRTKERTWQVSAVLNLHVLPCAALLSRHPQRACSRLFFTVRCWRPFKSSQACFLSMTGRWSTVSVVMVKAEMRSFIFKPPAIPLNYLIVVVLRCTSAFISYLPALWQLYSRNLCINDGSQTSV